MMQMCVTLLCTITCVALSCGCKSLERAVRHEQERKVREIVHEEVPVVVRHQVGDVAMRVVPWVLGPAGLGLGLGIKRKRGQANAAK